MSRASDFRQMAREALQGKWMLAVLVGLVASILGVGSSFGSKFELNLDLSGGNTGVFYGNTPIFTTGQGWSEVGQTLFVGGMIYIIIMALVFGISRYILGSIIALGYAKFNLSIMDRAEAGFHQLFAYFTYWKTALAAKFLKGLYVFLWTLLLIIPGIMAGYSYAMTEFILAEHPEMTAGEAIRKSKEMMEGNRWRLFCLDFSFIGWSILCAFTLGIGNLWLNPYTQTARAAFYREISGTGYRYERGVEFEDGYKYENI